MDNQHQKIKGYRDLSQEEVDLMNEVKELGAKLIEKQAELVEHLNRCKRRLHAQAFGGVNAPVDLPVDPADYSDAHKEYVRFNEAEPLRWAAIGKTDIQTGIMALVRAIAQPGGGV